MVQTVMAHNGDDDILEFSCHYFPLYLLIFCYSPTSNHLSFLLSALELSPSTLEANVANAIPLSKLHGS